MFTEKGPGCTLEFPCEADFDQNKIFLVAPRETAMVG
jgi:hypothetical protein